MGILLILHTGDKALAFSLPDQDEVADDLGEIQGQVRGMRNRRGTSWWSCRVSNISLVLKYFVFQV